MNQFLTELKNFPKKGDWVLLLLCLITSSFGCVCIASATSAAKFGGNFRYIAIQLGFCSQSHFNKLFKAHVHCTPKEYQEEAFKLYFSGL